MTDEPSDLFIELAKGPRRVRTPQGAQYYGVPVGGVITADIRARKEAENAAKGIAKPKGALAKATNRGAGAAALQSAASMPAAPKTPTAPKLKLVKSKLSGPHKWSIGAGNFSAPQGSTLYRAKDVEGINYVKTPEGKVHAFTQAGEVSLDPTLEQVLASKFEEDLKDDPTFEELPFSTTAASYGINNLKVGDVLTDPDGAPQFTKQEDGTFKHNVFDVSVKEKDLSSMYESGELIPAKSSTADANAATFDQTNAVDFKSMSLTEATEALDAQSAGTQISVHGNVLTKTEGTTWVGADKSEVESKAFASLKNDMQIVGTKEEPAPEPEEPETPEPKTTPKASEVPSPEEPKVDPLPEGVPEGATKLEGSQEEKQKALDSAKSGSIAYDPENQESLMKTSAELWLDDFTGHEWDSSNVSAGSKPLYLHESPPLADKKKFEEASVEPEALTPGPEDEPEKKYVKLDNDQSASIELASSTDTPWDYQQGDKIERFGHLRDMPEGSIIRIKDKPEVNGLPLTKQSDGTWKSDQGEVVSFNALADDIVVSRVYFETALRPVEDEQISLVPDGASFSQKDLKDALDALESHPSSQVAYGLKSLKDGAFGETEHKEEQSLLVATAKSAYPDLKSKPAVIKLLKEKLGLHHDDQESEKSEVAEEGPKIHFGEDEVKVSNFGASSGDFTVAEVEEAISLMEAFEGKTYLADLKNKGNPLGYLNDNALVGFDKDKTVKKQKMIDLLKQKLADHAVSEPVEPSESVPTSEEEADAPEVENPTEELADTPEVESPTEELTDTPEVPSETVPTPEEVADTPEVETTTELNDQSDSPVDIT